MKNKKMGILAVLVMLVAVTLNAVGGTYAKYISEYGMTDEARVAKWNFKDVSTTTVDLFQASYTNKDGVYVASSDAAKVVAPGTHGEYSYSVMGTAETNFKVTQSRSIENKVFLTDFNGNVAYNPLEFSFDGKNWFRTKTEVRDEKTNKVIALTSIAPEDEGRVFPANYDLKTGDVSGTIYWRWVFDAATAAKDAEDVVSDAATYSDDQLDTVLGDMVVNDSTLTIKASIGATVVQTEEVPSNIGTTYVTASNKLPDADAKFFAAKGYDASKVDVLFNGNTMTGTVYETVGQNAALAKAYFGKDTNGADNGTGYYYTINVRNVTNKAFYVKHSKEGKIQPVPANDSLSIMIALNNTNKKYVYTVYDTEADAEANRNGKEITIDYTNVTLQPAA